VSDDNPTIPDATPESDENERIPLRFLIPVGVTSRYAQHLIIQASDVDVTLSFFEVKAPIVLDPEGQKQALKDGVTAECVARVTIALARFGDFLKALNGVPGFEKTPPKVGEQ